MALAQVGIESAYGKIPYGEEDRFRFPNQLVSADIPHDSIMPAVRGLFQYVFKVPESERGTEDSFRPLRLRSLHLSAMARHYRTETCNVYSIQYLNGHNDERTGQHYDHSAVSFLEPTDGRVDYPMVHMHWYTYPSGEDTDLGQTAETEAYPLQDRGLAVARGAVNMLVGVTNIENLTKVS